MSVDLFAVDEIYECSLGVTNYLEINSRHVNCKFLKINKSENSLVRVIFFYKSCLIDLN